MMLAQISSGIWLVRTPLWNSQGPGRACARRYCCGYREGQVGSSVPTKTFLLTLRRNSEACLHMVEIKGQALVKAN